MLSEVETSLIVNEISAKGRQREIPRLRSE